MKRLVIVSLLAFLIAVVPTTALTLDNANGGNWSQYVSIPITTVPTNSSQYIIYINGTSWYLMNSTKAVKVSFNNSYFWNLVKSDGSDIRVANQSSQLYFWISNWDYANKTATIWVNLTANSTELDVYYGNPNATKSAYENKTLTFIFASEEESGAVSGWSVPYGTLTVSTDAIKGNYSIKWDVSTGGYEYAATKTIAKGSDIAIEGFVKYVIPSGGYSGVGFGVNLNGAGNSGNVNGVTGYTAYFDSSGYLYINYWDGTATNQATSTSVTTYNNTWYHFTVVRKSNGDINVELSDLNGNTLATLSYNDPSYYTPSISLDAFGGGVCYYDDVVVYSLLDPATFGTPSIVNVTTTTAPSNATSNVTTTTSTTTTVKITLDNSGGGSWNEYVSFPITNTLTSPAVYKIEIDNDVWKVKNVTGYEKATAYVYDFWSVVRSDGQDIRVFNQSSQLYFWIAKFDYVNHTAVIWVNVSAGSTELNVAYGNLYALKSAYENGSRVFSLFDDFSGTSLSPVFTVNYINSNFFSYNVSGGHFTLTISGESSTWDYVDIKTTKTFTRGYAFGLGIVSASGGLSQNKNLFIGFASFDSSLGVASPFNDGVMYHITYYYQNQYLYTAVGGTKTGFFAASGLPSNDFVLVTWENSGYSKIFINDALINTSSTTPNVPLSLDIMASIGSGTGTANVVLDYVFVAKLSDPATFGSGVIKFLKRSLNKYCIYVNVTHLDTGAYEVLNPQATYDLVDKPYINVTSITTIGNVNATVGANVTIQLAVNVTLDKVVFNGTDVTANVTYAGTVTNSTTGITYNVYTLKVYENGSLEVYGHLPNVAYNTTYKLDGQQVNISTTPAVVGEVLAVELPHVGNVTIGNQNFTYVTTASVNTLNLGVGAWKVEITIDDPTNFTLGYVNRSITVKFGSITPDARFKDGSPFTNVTYKVFNVATGNMTANTSQLYAGENVLYVYFHDVKIGQKTFYLNHTNDGQTVTVITNSTRIKDYRGVNRTIASLNTFSVENLSSRYPYSTMKLVGVNGDVVVDFGAKAPTSVSVEGASYWNYSKPVLKLNAIGNVTVTDLYKLGVQFLDRLGHYVNFYVLINNTRVDAANGVAAKLVKCGNYEIVVPTTVNGFVLYSFTGSNVIEVNGSDVVFTATYKVPTKFEVKIYNVSSTEKTVTIRVDGVLKDYYGDPVPYKNVTVTIIATNAVRTFNVTTSDSGAFTVETTLDKGTSYDLKLSFAGDDVYVSTTNTTTINLAALPSAPTPTPTPTPAPSYTAVAIAGIVGLFAGALIVYALVKKHIITAVARKKLEDEFRFFRRIK